MDFRFQRSTSSEICSPGLRRIQKWSAVWNIALRNATGRQATSVNGQAFIVQIAIELVADIPLSVTDRLERDMSMVPSP